MIQLSDLSQWVKAREDEIEEALKHFVDMNTYTANEQGVDRGMNELSRMAENMGFTVEAVNGRHLLIKAGNGQGKPRILLLSHMDTVFPPDGEFLRYERLPDGYAHGPGVGDIKGGMLMGLYAMKALSEMLEDFDVQMAVSANEETGSPTIRDWYMGGHIGADYAIGLEPGFPQGELSPTVALGVVYQRRGYGAIRFKVIGKACHSGTTHLGVNAIEAMAQRIVRIHALSDPDKGISTTVGMVNGGISPNTVAGEVTGTASFRFTTREDGEYLKQTVEDIITASYVTNEDLGLSDRGEFEVEAFIPPMEYSPENQVLVDIVLEEASRLNQNVVAIARGGGSDANFTSAAGTPSICGMGAPTHGLHTTEEKIYLPGMFERIELLASVLYRLVAVGEKA